MKEIKYVEDYLNLALIHIQYMNVAAESKEKIRKAINKAIDTTYEERYVGQLDRDNSEL